MINPLAWIEDSSIELLRSVGLATVYEVKQECVIIATPKMTPLYAIPDTHRVVSVEFLQDLLTDAYLHPHDSAVALKLCEIIDVK